MDKALPGLRRAMSFRAGVSATVQTVMVNVVVLGFNFGTGVITARVLGPDGRGAQAAMQMWPRIMAIALTIGLPTALLYNLRRHPERGAQFFLTAVLMGLVMGLLATLVGVVLIPLWLTAYSPTVVRAAQWFMLFCPLVLLLAAFNNVLRARQEFTAFNVVRCLVPTLTLLILATFALSHRLTPFVAALAYMVPYVPIFLWLMVRLWRTYRPRWGGLRASFHSLTSYGIRSYGVDILGHLVAGQLDRILVVGLLEPAAMGLYVVAVSLARTLDVFPAAVAQVVLPKAAGRSVEEVVTLIGRGVRVSTTIALFSASLLAIFGPWALKLVFGHEFLQAVPVFRLLLAEVVISGATWVLAQAFLASNRPGVTSIMQGIGLSLNMPLLLVLVPKYGLIGAGLSLLIATTVRFAFAVANYPISLRVRPPGLRPRWSDFASIIYRTDGDE